MVINQTQLGELRKRHAEMTDENEIKWVGGLGRAIRVSARPIGTASQFARYCCSALPTSQKAHHRNTPGAHNKKAAE